MHVGSDTEKYRNELYPEHDLIGAGTCTVFEVHHIGVGWLGVDVYNISGPNLIGAGTVFEEHHVHVHRILVRGRGHLHTRTNIVGRGWFGSDIQTFEYSNIQ